MEIFTVTETNGNVVSTTRIYLFLLSRTIRFIEEITLQAAVDFIEETSSV